jgi:hypothetical protein
MDGWVGVKAVLRIAYSNQKDLYIRVDLKVTQIKKERRP